MTNPIPEKPPKKSLLSEVFEVLSKVRLFDIKVHVDKVEIGDKSFKIENGFVVLGNEAKLKISKDEKGNPIFLKDGTSISTVKETKKENIYLLENEKRAFSRADISEVQIEYMSIEKKHETIIKKLKPFLEGYRNNWDMASLLVAGTIIRLEDAEQKNQYMITIYMNNLNFYKNIGRMVYNLFRSGVLEKEIIPHAEKLKEFYGIQKGRQQFLIEWHDILQGRYPTAHFMQHFDDESKLAKELDWRFNRQVDYVDIYSRGYIRNERTKELCIAYCKKNKNFEMNIGRPYKLGLTKAIKIRVQRKK